MKKLNYHFESHSFRIIDSDDGSSRALFDNNEGRAFIAERRKLYIIQDDKEILYIGEAHSSINVRFQRACVSFNHFMKTGKARGAYKGYKWLDRKENLSRKLRVSVAIFEEAYDAKEQRCIIEAIEGELVYRVRKELKYWPKFQNEIHFKDEPGARETASEIFERIKP